MKQKLILIGTLILMLLKEMDVYAAPKTMDDGTVFDAEFYAEAYADVKAAFGTDETALYNHYVTYGQKEGRLPVAPTVQMVEAGKQQITELGGVCQDLTAPLPAYSAEQDAFYTQKVPVKIGKDDSRYLRYQTDYYYEALAKERADYSADPIYKAARNYITQLWENGWDEQVIYLPIYFRCSSEQNRDYLNNMLMNLSVDLRKAEIGKTVWVSYSSADGCLHWGKPWENGAEYQLNCLILDWDIHEGWK